MSREEFDEAISNITYSFTQSKEKIGAPSLIWKLLPRRAVSVSKKFAEGKPISNVEILEYRKVWLSEDPLIDENGKPFVFYIHDFANAQWGKPNRVFHVAWCKTLEDMDSNGRRARYVKKSDLDNNNFIVDYGDNNMGVENLPACLHCKEKMRKIVAPTQLYYERTGMNISHFFILYGKQDLLDVNNPIYPVSYPENWNAISQNLRERAGWKCSECGKDYSSDRSNLHVHHKDGRRGVVHAGNLEVLCMKCHTNRPYHSHLKALKA